MVKRRFKTSLKRLTICEVCAAYLIDRYAALKKAERCVRCGRTVLAGEVQCVDCRRKLRDAARVRRAVLIVGGCPRCGGSGVWRPRHCASRKENNRAYYIRNAEELRSKRRAKHARQKGVVNEMVAECG